MLLLTLLLLLSILYPHALANTTLDTGTVECVPVLYAPFNMTK
jgi:hypothetical protein